MFLVGFRTRVRKQGLIAGLGDSNFILVNLQFADDIPVPSFEKLRNLKLLIYLFEHMTGLSINLRKSSAISLRGDAFHHLEIASMFNCKVDLFLLFI